MDEDVVELLVRLACGEASEPPLRGVVQVDHHRFRIWKHGERLRVETAEGELRAIREPKRLVTFLDGPDKPLVSESRIFALEDEDAPFRLVSRPQLHLLELSERRAVGPVERGVRFGRPTAAVTLEHTYHEDFALTLVVDAATGMPFEMVEAGTELLRWLELEVLEEVDESLLRWDGETRSGRWFAYVGQSGGLDGDGDIPREAREHWREAAPRSDLLAQEFDRSPVVARIPMDLRVESFAPGVVIIELESDLFLSVRGQAVPDPDEEPRSRETWTTADGWSWTVHGAAVEDPELIATLRERISTWRATRSPSDAD